MVLRLIVVSKAHNEGERMSRLTGIHLWLLALSLCTVLGSQARAATTVTVRNAAELREAVRSAGPGRCILVASGEYPGGFGFSQLRGEAGKPIVIAAADGKRPPVFRGGGVGIHLIDPAHVELRNLHFSGASGNGINIDDGGSYDTPARDIVLRGLRVTEVGPHGNCDGIKLSGVDSFRIVGCTIDKWGVGGGSAIDMVGCHRGVIEGCTFRHTDRTNNTGVQVKGGSSDIAIRRNRFEHAGSRGVNIGGSTGLRYFRPALGTSGRGPAHNYEASRIHVEGNVFIGSMAPVAFVGCDQSYVRFNTIYRPRAWILRILQETRDPSFVPSRNGEFTDNIIAFRSDEIRTTVNIGAGTAPGTFRFARNAWYCIDNPDRSRPSLPAKETDGLYGEDPLFRDAAKADFHLRRNSPAITAGAYAQR